VDHKNPYVSPVCADVAADGRVAGGHCRGSGLGRSVFLEQIDRRDFWGRGPAKPADDLLNAISW
jgi:hypothetical protein